MAGWIRNLLSHLLRGFNEAGGNVLSSRRRGREVFKLFLMLADAACAIS